MKRMFHAKHGWTYAESVHQEKWLMERGWVEDKPEYSPKYVPPTVAVSAPGGSPNPPISGPSESASIFEPKRRGRPPKAD